MKRYAFPFVLLIIAILANPSTAHAYIGPGLAGGAVSTILGSAGALLMLFAGAVWYPIRRAIDVLRHRQD